MSRVIHPHHHWAHQYQPNHMHQSLDPSDYLYDDDEDDEPLTLMRSSYGSTSQSINPPTSLSSTRPTTTKMPPVKQALNGAYSQNHSSIKQWNNQSSNAPLARSINQSTDETPLLAEHEPLSTIKELDPTNQPTSQTTSQSFQQRLRLIVYVVLAVFVTAANALTWKRTLNRFKAADGSGKNFEFFVTQLTIFLYVVLAFAILFYRWFFTDCIDQSQKDAVMFRSSNQSDDEPEHSYPEAMSELALDQSTELSSTQSNVLSSFHRKLMLMGFCDSLAGLCSSFGGAFSTGQVQTVINQFNIPLTLMMGRVFLMNEYSMNQGVGAGVIVLGSLLCTLHSTSADSASTLWFGPLLLLVSCVPNSASNIFKEWSFRAQNLDVFLMTTLVSLYQVLLGFCFTPLLVLPALGGISLTQVPSSFAQGWSCFTGEYLPGFECHLSPFPWFILLVYVLVNFGLNVLLLLITKHGSALLLVISSAVSLPFTNLLFTSEWLMGREAEDWSWQNAAGLAIVVVGFLIYSLMTDENGEFMPVQGAAGQMMYVTEAPAAPPVRRRRHSWDATLSPIVTTETERRKKEARKRANTEREKGGKHVDEERIFFTPP